MIKYDMIYGQSKTKIDWKKKIWLWDMIWHSLKKINLGQTVENLNGKKFEIYF